MNGRTVALLLAIMLLAVPVGAAEPDGWPVVQIAGVEVGLAGQYRTGVWTQVRITLQSGEQAVEGQLALTVPDSDGAPNCLATSDKQPVRVPAGATVTVPLYARFGRLESELGVEFLPQNAPAVRRVFQASASPGEGQFPAALPSTARLVGYFGENATGLERALELVRQQPGEQPAVARLSQVASLPRQWYGYEALESLVLSTSNPQLFADLKPEGPEIIALDKWLRMGGRLVLSVGSQAERILAPGAPLARFSPGSLQRMVPQWNPAALESFVNSSVQVLGGRGGRVELAAPQLQDLRGTVELRDGNLPLVIRRPWGLGQVIFVAVDLDVPPLAAWPNRGLLYGRLLDLPVTSRSQDNEHAAVMHYGFRDISGQLRSALDQYPGVWPVSFSWVAGLIVLYLLLIGPVDYFLLRKLSPRMELTWLTFPLIVVALGVAAYLLAYRFKGNEARANQVAVIDVDTESRWVRGTCWANVFSPQMARYDLSCRAIPLGTENSPANELLFSWLGLPGNALGGMDAGTVTALRQPYTTTPALDALQGVPIPIWASKSFTARWNSTSSGAPTAEFRQQDQALSGRIINDLDFPLHDCLLVYGRWVYELGTLQPKQMESLSAATRRRELKTFLTGQHLVFLDEAGNRPQQELIPYDRASLDPAYILRMMMFFEAGGGRGYTGLMNRYQHFVDLSPLLKAERAILVGTAPREEADAARYGSQLLREGEPIRGANDLSLTVYRFVYPVTTEP